MAALAVLALGTFPKSPAKEPPSPERLRVRVIRSFAHDPSAFTQGLVFHEGKLYESTGLYGYSSLRRVNAQTGAVEKKVALESALFGEGLARVGGRLYQLTWKEQRALVWDLATLEREREFGYEGEGWGLCFDGKSLIMSDGTDRLTRRDPRTFEKTGELLVRSAGAPVEKLNELECVGGVVYANIWLQPTIARIDAGTGSVTGWIDAGGLLKPEEYRAADVLNGIAHVPGSERFIITGKRWPRAFEVEFVPVSPPARKPSRLPRRRTAAGSSCRWGTITRADRGDASRPEFREEECAAGPIRADDRRGGEVDTRGSVTAVVGRRGRP